MCALTTPPSPRVTTASSPKLAGAYLTELTTTVRVALAFVEDMELILLSCPNRGAVRHKDEA